MASMFSFRKEITKPLGNGERQPEAIKMLDRQPLSWFHIKVIIVAVMGFFCEAYDLFVISFITNTIGRVYYPDQTYYSPTHCDLLGLNGTSCGSNYPKYAAAGISPEQAAVQIPAALPNNINNAIKATALVGTLFGQLAFGWLGDRYGRRPMFAASLAILIFGAIAQGLSFGSTPSGVVSTLCLWRFVLGFGIGGDYPLSSTYMSEYASKSNRGALVAAVFAMQGTGILVAAAVTIIVAAIFNGYPESADYVWRIVLMFGAVPAMLTMYFRITLPETPRYTFYAEHNEAQMVADMATVLPELQDSEKARIVKTRKQVRKATLQETLHKFGWQLFGTASSWFLLDIAYYSQNFFQPAIYTDIGWIPAAYTMDPITEAYQTARANAIIALASTIPGYWMTVFTIEKMGRIPIQLMGFAMMTLMMVIMAAAYTQLTETANVPAFIVLYALAFFFSNWGPNATTFIIPAELFPAAYRTSGHGFSAACGKTGSILGTFGFGAALTAIGTQNTLAILAAVNFLGIFTTFFIPETKNLSLEEISGDDEEATTSTATDTSFELEVPEEASKEAIRRISEIPTNQRDSTIPLVKSERPAQDD